jgi:hypothetical protein
MDRELIMAEPYFQDLFSKLADQDIIARVKSGLNPDAHEMACRELRRRGIEPPSIAEEPVHPEEPPYLGDRVILARDLEPTEAHILAARLAAAGIHADPGDVNTVQTNALWTIAVGGAKIRVPQSQLAEARRILDAYRRGVFALGDDFDTGNGVE